MRLKIFVRSVMVEETHVTYIAKYTACENSKRNWLDTGMRGRSLGTKLDSLPYEER